MFTSRVTATLVSSMGNDLAPAYAAWVSTGRGIDRTEAEAIALVERLGKEKHHTCFEHQTATFEIEVPIYIGRQLLRYRHLSPNELSGRYKSFSNSQAFILELLPEQAQHIIMDNFERCLENYRVLRAIGVKKEDSRAVLPLNTMTRIQATANLREWCHIVHQRDSGHAQYEIRLIAQQIKIQLLKLWPVSTINLLDNM